MFTYVSMVLNNYIFINKFRLKNVNYKLNFIVCLLFLLFLGKKDLKPKATLNLNQYHPNWAGVFWSYPGCWAKNWSNNALLADYGLFVWFEHVIFSWEKINCSFYFYSKNWLFKKSCLYSSNQYYYFQCQIILTVIRVLKYQLTDITRTLSNKKYCSKVSLIALLSYLNAYRYFDDVT